jgi:DNA-binding GntR family transcriptional regulator
VIEKYGQNIDKNALCELGQRLLEAKETGDTEKGTELDNELHTFIVKFSKNRYFIKSMEQLIPQSHRIRIMVPSHWSEAEVEHISIVNSILAENYREAAKHSRTHLENSKNCAYDTLMKNGGWALP